MLAVQRASSAGVKMRAVNASGGHDGLGELPQQAEKVKEKSARGREAEREVGREGGREGGELPWQPAIFKR